MFETTVNIFENALITAFIVLLAKNRKPMKRVLIYASLYFLFSYFFISYINHFSYSQSFLVIIDYAAGWILACLISYDSLGYKLLSGVLPYNLLGISNVLLDMTASYILFGTINYHILMANYRIPIVLAAQVIHVILYALCIYIFRHMFPVVQEKDYFILSGIFILLDLMSICFETVALQFDHYERYMLVGIYLIIVFAAMIIVLFRSIYRHSIHETQQTLELDIMRSQESSNQKILEAQNSLNEIRHDMKHFIALLEQSDIHSTELQELIDRYHQASNSSAVPIQTSCAPINYVLNIKREEAFARGITFITKTNIPHEVKMETGDIFLNQ